MFFAVLREFSAFCFECVKITVVFFTHNRRNKMLQSIKFLRKKRRGEVEGDTKPTPLAPVILGLVPRIFWQQGTNLVNKLALLNKCLLREDSWDKPKNDWCRGRGVSAYSQSGRSMIEMLGVLAIVGVLSVGGIAGYSKAMEKFKVNRAIEEYSYLIHGLMEYRNDIVKMENKSGLVNLSEQLNLLPPTWAKINASEMQDSNGETLTLYMRNDNSFQSVPRILLNVNLVSKFSQDFCRELLDNLARPLHSALLHICIYRPKSGSTDYYGDAYCDTDDKICLHSVSLAQINEDCKKCDNENEICNLAITF